MMSYSVYERDKISIHGVAYMYFHCKTPHICNASFDSDYLGQGNDIPTYDEKDVYSIANILVK